MPKNSVHFLFMNENTERRFERLVNILKRSGMTVAAFRKEADISSQTWNNWKDRDIPASKIPLILKHLQGVTADYILTGENDPYEHGIKPGQDRFAVSDKNKHLIEEGTDLNLIELGGFLTWNENTPLEPDEIYLPLFREVRLAAGAGICEVQENHGPKLRFAESTLKRYGVAPEAAACVIADGTSMEPIIPHGSTIGVDTSKTEIRDGRTYAIDHNGHLRIKLVYRMPDGGLRLKSYNTSEYPDEIYTAENAAKIKILGFVFWWSVMNKW